MDFCEISLQLNRRTPDCFSTALLKNPEDSYTVSYRGRGGYQSYVLNGVIVCAFHPRRPYALPTGFPQQGLLVYACHKRISTQFPERFPVDSSMKFVRILLRILRRKTCWSMPYDGGMPTNVPQTFPKGSSFCFHEIPSDSSVGFP